MPIPSELKNVFVTGATGVLGGHVLKRLLEETGAKAHCLVRARDPDEGSRKLREVLAGYGCGPRTLGEAESRAVPILGDVTQPGMGWEEEARLRLARDMDLVIHAAANTHLALPYRSLRGVNVNGTRHAVDFALLTPRKRLLHVSSYSIGGDRYLRDCEPFQESDLDIGQGLGASGYPRSKLEGEFLVRGATGAGLRWTIVRPGDIMGESDTGAYPLSRASGLYYDMLKTALETGLAARLETYLNITPVDYVSRALLHLACRDDSVEKTYHLTSPKPLRFREVAALLRECGHPIELLPVEEYLGRIKNDALRVGDGWYTSDSIVLMCMAPESSRAAEASYPGSAYTRSVLEPEGIRCPPIDAKLLGTYVRFCERVGFIRPRGT